MILILTCISALWLGIFLVTKWFWIIKYNINFLFYIWKIFYQLIIFFKFSVYRISYLFIFWSSICLKFIIRNSLELLAFNTIEFTYSFCKKITIYTLLIFIKVTFFDFLSKCMLFPNNDNIFDLILFIKLYLYKLYQPFLYILMKIFLKICIIL